GSGWCTHVYSDRAGIDRGEKILSEERSEAERRQGYAEKAAGEPQAMLQSQFEQAQIALPQSFEIMFEPVLEAGEKAFRRRSAIIRTSRMMVLVAQEKMRHCRHQRIGQNVRGNHREDDRHRQRSEQITGDPAKRKQRYESDADAKQRNRR